MEAWEKRVVVAYLDEPPFCVPPASAARPSGCDMDVAHHVLTAAGVARVSYTLTTFPELIPGLLDGRWHMTTPIFVTGERAALVDFSRPVWAAGDGFVVRRPEAGRYTSYEAIATSPAAVLAVVRGQVQHQTALLAGVPPVRIVEYADQDAAVRDVRDGRADAAASTAVGNRAYLQRAGAPDLVAVADVSPARDGRLARGAFAFARRHRDLRAAVDAALGDHLGSAEHVELMARYGFPADEVRRGTSMEGGLPRGTLPRR